MITHDILTKQGHENSIVCFYSIITQEHANKHAV